MAQLDYDPDAAAAANLAELGEAEYLHQVVEEARRRTFRDGRLQTLAWLAALLAGQAPAGADRPGALFGTTAFEQVWEAACRVAFADRSAALPLALPVASWHPLAGAVAVYQNPGNRLIPDVIWFDEKTLLIADAKYYTPVYQPTGRLAYNPGMPDLTKQLLYEQALLPGLRAAGYAQEQVYNVFILPASRPPAPTETMAQWQWGHAQTNIAGWEGRRVAIWLVPPALLLDAYLQGVPVAWAA